MKVLYVLFIIVILLQAGWTGPMVAFVLVGAVLLRIIFAPVFWMLRS